MSEITFTKRFELIAAAGTTLPGVTRLSCYPTPTLDLDAIALKCPNLQRVCIGPSAEDNSRTLALAEFIRGKPERLNTVQEAHVITRLPRATCTAVGNPQLCTIEIYESCVSDLDEAMAVIGKLVTLQISPSFSQLPVHH